MVSQRDAKYKELYVAFNTSHLSIIISLPGREGSRWRPLVDTSKVAPYDFLSEEDITERERSIAVAQFSHFVNSNIYPMASYSSIILTLVPEGEQ